MMTEITYRLARKTDAVSIAAIHVASWRDAYRSILDPEFLAGPIEDDRFAVWTERLEASPANLVVEVASGSDGQLKGFIAAFRDHDPLWGSLIDNLHVLPEMRGQMIGKALMRSAARTLEMQNAGNGLHLYVFQINEAGLRFYKRLGGQVVGQDTASIPGAKDEIVLRVHWPTFSSFFCKAL